MGHCLRMMYAQFSCFLPVSLSDRRCCCPVRMTFRQEEKTVGPVKIQLGVVAEIYCGREVDAGLKEARSLRARGISNRTRGFYGNERD